jgi:hypothetical protein
LWLNINTKTHRRRPCRSTQESRHGIRAKLFLDNLAAAVAAARNTAAAAGYLLPPPYINKKKTDRRHR